VKCVFLLTSTYMEVGYGEIGHKPLAFIGSGRARQCSSAVQVRTPEHFR
jgi:hypothetical protein